MNSRFQQDEERLPRSAPGSSAIPRRALAFLLLLQFVPCAQPLAGNTEQDSKTQQPDHSIQEVASSASGTPTDDSGSAGSSEELEDLSQARPFRWTRRAVMALITGRQTFTLLDEKARFRFGVGLRLDGTTGSESKQVEDQFGRIDSSLKVRSLRLKSHGSIYDMIYAVSIELGTELSLRDAWVDSEEGGLSIWGQSLGRFRVGHQKEPFSFERQTSTDYISFLERSLPVATFAPDHSLGAALHGVTEDRRQQWSLGFFSFGSSGQDQDSKSAFSVTGRWTGLPIYEDDGKTLLHIGASISGRSPSGRTRYFARPEARYVAPYAETNNIDASGIQLYGAELAMVKDALWAQAEWIISKLEAAEVGNPTFNGQYIQVGWFLTGQSRPYRRAGGVFDSFRPEFAYAGRGQGARLLGGAYELVGRYSRVDLNDAGLQGGELHDLTVGFNWYLRADTKISLNYIYADPEDRGHAQIALIRLQYAPW